MSLPNLSKALPFTATLAVLATAGTLGATPETETGTITFRHSETNERVVVFYARSSEYRETTPPVLVLHGMNRNPWDYRDAWTGLAAAHDLFIFVPYFREEDYPGPVGYNLGNVFESESDLTRRPASQWSYRLPDLVFTHLRESGETRAAGYLAFGHSAGSQFLHRKIGFAPDERMLLAVAANAGWYTFPDLETPWPYGYGGTGLREPDLVPYFESALHILLGDQDTDPEDSSLRRAPEAMKQGRHRLERGHSFFQAARARAAKMETPFNWTISEVPGVGHDNAGMAPAAARIFVDFIESRSHPRSKE
jgi:hypothetical protein